MGQKTSYRILKLKNGEELIASICGQEKNKLIIERPMSFHTTSMQNSFGAMQHMTILHNWLGNSDQLTTKIPKEEILTFLDPSEEAIKLYEIEKENEDTPFTQTIDEESFNLFDFIRDNFYNGSQQEESPEHFNNLLSDLMDLNKDKFPTEPMNPLMENPTEENNLEEHMENYISMTLFFPPKALMTFVDAGLLDLEDVKDMIDQINHNPSKDKKRKDRTKQKNKKPNKRKEPKSDPEDIGYGNNWYDWSKDLDDYFN
jgi:hypothetical protein